MMFIRFVYRSSCVKKCSLYSHGWSQSRDAARQTLIGKYLTTLKHIYHGKYFTCHLDSLCEEQQ